MQQQRILEQVDAMVASGRVTADEAARLRAAGGPEAFETVVTEIRLRHAQAHMEPAVATRQLSAEEAEHYAERIRHGEHPTGLRARLARLRRA
jgi:hypothetical protein